VAAYPHDADGWGGAACASWRSAPTCTVAASGTRAALASARLLAAGIDNPDLARLLDGA
jgi:hypothetical protein